MNTKTATTMKTVEEMIAFVVSECEAVDMTARFEESLNYDGPVTVAGLEFDPSRILKELDRIAYDCYLGYYVDGEEVTEIGDSYYENKDVETAREQFIDDLRDSLSDLESEKEEFEEKIAEDSELTFTDEIANLDAQIAAMESRIAELERYTF